ncbi:MAG: dTDP-4-dehydrorhamnose reductase [Mycobacterium sp.]
MASRIVISGAGGLLGRVLAGQAAQLGRDVLALTSAEWDITDATAGERFIAHGDIVINCAGYTQVDVAEAEPERAMAVNAIGPQFIAQTCARAGASLIHLSTDYVFSGSFDLASGPESGPESGIASRNGSCGEPRPYEIDDETGPLSVYGRTKLAGESRVLSAMPDAHVVRTAWIYEGGDGSDFAATMRRAAAGSGTVEVVADQVGSPTYVGDLAGALLQIADGSIREPVLHAANGGAVSRFEQAQAIFEEVGADPNRVRPVGSDRHPRPAPRPMYSALSGVKSAAAGLTPLRPWREALAEALAVAGPISSTP